MRLIDADALIAEISPPVDAPNDGAKLILSVFIEAVKSFPAVDAVEVVRCRECRWCHAGFCELHDDIIPWGRHTQDGETGSVQMVSAERTVTHEPMVLLPTMRQVDLQTNHDGKSVSKLRDEYADKSCWQVHSCNMDLRHKKGR